LPQETTASEDSVDLGEEYPGLAALLRDDPQCLLEILDRYELVQAPPGQIPPLGGEQDPSQERPALTGFLCRRPHLDEDGVRNTGSTLIVSMTLAGDDDEDAVKVIEQLRGMQKDVRLARLVEDVIGHELSEHE
jgi:hypothetical protein